jgi:hypothetical protein
MLGIVSILTAGVTGSAAAQTLPSTVAETIQAFDPTLTFPAEGGIVHVSDFDGDGREDVTTVLVGTERRALVVFRATPRGYEPHPLYASLPGGDFELRIVAPGRRRVLDPQGMIEHATPALELVFPGRSSALYVWREGRFRVFQLERR